MPETFALRSCKGFDKDGKPVDCGHRLEFAVHPMSLDDGESFIGQVNRLQVLRGLADLRDLPAEERAAKIREAGAAMVKEARDAMRQILGLGLGYAFPADFDLGKHLDLPTYRAFKDVVWRVNEYGEGLDPYQPGTAAALAMLAAVRISSSVMAPNPASTTSDSSSARSKAARAGKPAGAAPTPAPASPSPSTEGGTETPPSP